MHTIKHRVTVRISALLAALLAVAGLTLVGTSNIASARLAGQKPTILLVHGAFADGASWGPSSNGCNGAVSPLSPWPTRCAESAPTPTLSTRA
jgi:hypothetical protein